LLLKSKVLNFITPEDDKKSAALKAECERLEEELKQYTATASDLIDSYSKYSDDEIAAMHSKNKKEWDRYAAGWVKRYRDVERQMREHVKAIRERYYKSFNGDTDAILQDAREIIDAITMQDYIDDYNAPETSKLREQHLESIKELSGEYYDFFRSLHEMGFMSCTVFIDQQLLDQKLALAYYGYGGGDNEPSRALVHLVETKAAEFFPAEPAKAPTKQEPRKLSSEEIRAAIESDKLTARLIEQPFFTVPTSPAIESTLRLLSSRGNLAQMKERRPTVCHSQKIETFVPTGGGKGRKVTFETMGVSSISITISALDKLLHAPKAKKMFIYALKKINDQVFSGGELKRDYATFRLQELVDIGYYSTIQSARVGFKEAMETLTDIKVSGELREGKSKELKSDVLAPLFRGYDLLGKGVYCFYIEPRINWAMVCAFYTSLPRFYFELHSRASELLYFISVRARQCAGEIRQRGYITISMRAVQERLSLPSENEIKNPERDIKKPIMEAIAEINERSGESGNITLELIGSGKRQIADFLDNAYIKASIGGEYAVTFKEIAANQQKQIEAAQKRREAITERAIAQNLAKKLESSAADQSGEPPKRKRGRPRKNQ